MSLWHAIFKFALRWNDCDVGNYFTFSGNTTVCTDVSLLPYSLNEMTSGQPWKVQRGFICSSCHWSRNRRFVFWKVNNSSHVIIESESTSNKRLFYVYCKWTASYLMKEKFSYRPNTHTHTHKSKFHPAMSVLTHTHNKLIKHNHHQKDKPFECSKWNLARWSIFVDVLGVAHVSLSLSGGVSVFLWASDYLHMIYIFHMTLGTL